MQTLVYAVCVELEWLKTDNLLLVGFESQVDLAGQWSIILPTQHYLQQIYQQLRVLQFLDHFQRTSQIYLVYPQPIEVIKRISLHECANLDYNDCNGKGLANIRMQLCLILAHV